MAMLAIHQYVEVSFFLLGLFFKYGLASKNLQNRTLFSDKTLYHFVEKPISMPPRCEPVHINMVIRHGSRYPGRDRIRRMKKVLNIINPFFLGNTSFRYKQLSLPWSFPSDIENSASKELSALGGKEMYAIARRFLARFHNILQHGYSNSNYSFVSTDKLRSTQSAIAFAQGIFEGKGHLGPKNYQPVAIKFTGSSDDDRVLRIFEACRKWQKLTAKRNPQSEYAKFMTGPEMHEVIRNISARLKLAKKVTLRPGMVVDMFWTCAFGIQTDSADTSWCSVFEDRDLKVLEYLNDLKLYWERSYGREINYKMACPLYVEIADSFKRFIKNGKPHGVFRFAHTGTVIPLLTMLGLFNDSVPPRADNFYHQASREFRTSNVVPMSANVAFVLYKCGANNESDEDIKGKGDCLGQCQQSVGRNPYSMSFNTSEMKIQLFVNEVAVSIPACGNKMYCSVQQFLLYHSLIKANCNIEAICGRRRKCMKRKKNRHTD